MRIFYADADHAVVCVHHDDGRMESAFAGSEGASRLVSQYGTPQNYAAPAPLSAELLEAQCLAALNGGVAGVDLQKLIKAVVISAEAYRLGKSPAQLTAQELQAVRQRHANIYKAL